VRARADATAVTRGSDAWDKVEAIQKGLTYYEPDEVAISSWEKGHRADAAEHAAWFATAPDREKYLEHLAVGDGR
jgi:hypothetical protein